MMLACKSLPKVSKSFTLIEILATIAIMAVLVTVAGFFIVGYVQYSKETADRQTLAVLNDALTRYKCEGGDISALTASAPISHVLAKLKATVQWGGPNGVTHQFLKTDFTVPGRSLFASGDRHQYRFTKYNTYELEAGGVSTEESSGFTPSPGVGYIAVNDANGIWMTCQTDTGYWALQYGSTTSVQPSGSWSEGAPASSATFFACLSDGTPSGGITQVTCDECNEYNGNCFQNVSTLDISGLSSIQALNCGYNQLTSLNVSGLPGLQVLYCKLNQLGPINTTGCTSLPAPSTNNSTNFVIDATATVTGQWTYP